MQNKQALETVTREGGSDMPCCDFCGCKVSKECFVGEADVMYVCGKIDCNERLDEIIEQYEIENEE